MQITLEGHPDAGAGAGHAARVAAARRARVPFSCQAGNCGTCKCEVVSGEVHELAHSAGAVRRRAARGIVLPAARSRRTSSGDRRRMKICRFDDDRLGLVEAATCSMRSAPRYRCKWPYRHGDALIAHLPAVPKRRRAPRRGAPPPRRGAAAPPVANPSKIVNAPINYQAHIDEAKRDQGIAHGREIKTIADWGLFSSRRARLPARATASGCAFRATQRPRGELAVVMGEANRVRARGARLCLRLLDRPRHDFARPRASELPQVDRHL